MPVPTSECSPYGPQTELNKICLHTVTLTEHSVDDSLLVLKPRVVHSSAIDHHRTHKTNATKMPSSGVHKTLAIDSFWLHCTNKAHNERHHMMNSPHVSAVHHQLDPLQLVLVIQLLEEVLGAQLLLPVVLSLRVNPTLYCCSGWLCRHSCVHMWQV